MQLFEPIRRQKLSVIVPVYNEQNAIIDNLTLLVSEIDPFFSDYEILVINDGSTDHTSQSLQKITNKHIRVINFTQNHGKGFAVRNGFKEALGDYILFIDGGMELHPKEIKVFLGLMSLYEADIVIGSKRHPQSQVHYPIFRRLLSMIYQRLLRCYFNLDVTDTQVGLKLFRAPVIHAIVHELQIDRYGFDIELLALAQIHGFSKMLEAPIKMDYFEKNSRGTLLEVLHVIKIGYFVLKDTVNTYFRLRNRI